MYLDSAIAVKLLTREPDSLHWARLVDGQVLFSSELMRTECFSALLRKEREGAITRRQRQRAARALERDIEDQHVTLVAVSSDVLRTANAMLVGCHPAIALRSLDAINLASAQRTQSWPIVTNDARMRQAAARLALPLAALPGAGARLVRRLGQAPRR